MRSSLPTIFLAVAGYFALMPASAEAYVITSITGHVTGRAYTSGYRYDGVYGSAGMSYDETLAPEATTLTGQASNNSYGGASAKSSLAFANSLNELAFSTAVKSTLIYGYGYSSIDSQATLRFDVNFTLTESTEVSILFNLDHTEGNQAHYQIGANNSSYAGGNVTLAQISGSDRSLLYSRGTGGGPFDPDGDGVFYASILPAGDYVFTIDSYSASYADAFANGALRFSPSLSPVPEPGGAFLIALGLASFLRRRRAVDCTTSSF